LAVVRQAVLSHKFIRSASVYREADGGIAIDIVERSPIAVISDEAGLLRYLDEDAVLLPYRMIKIGNDVPVIHGVTSNGRIDTSAIRGVVSLLTQLRDQDEIQVFNDVSEIDFHEKEKTYFLTTSTANTRIIFGQLDKYEEKIGRLLSYLKSYGKQDNLRAASLIDLRWSNRVIISYKNSTKIN
jgi:hypothetical protein